MKQHSQFFAYALLFSIVLVFPGCTRYINWGKDVFNQGVSLDKYTTIPEKYVRTARIYDQFTTLGIFDALWLDDEVKMEYVQSFALRNAYSDAQQAAMLDRERKDNENYYSFYFLATYPCQDKHGLNSKESPWTIRLVINGDVFAPVDIKLVELEPEYRAFFGKRFTVFKKPYLVRFNAHDESGNQLIKNGSQVKLMLRSVGHEVDLIWRLDSSGNVMESCSIDATVLAYDVDCLNCA